MDTLLHVKTGVHVKCSVEPYKNLFLKFGFTSQHVLTPSYITCLNDEMTTFLFIANSNSLETLLSTTLFSVKLLNLNGIFCI